MQTFDAPATRAALPFARLSPRCKACSRKAAKPRRATCTSPRARRRTLHVADHAGLDRRALLRHQNHQHRAGQRAPRLAGAARELPPVRRPHRRPLAVIDGDAITHHRTAAASALAARGSARAGAAPAGGGRRPDRRPAAACLPRGAADRASERLGTLAREGAGARRAVAAEGLPARAVTDLQAACGDADIVSCATLATEPVVHGAWLRPGTHLDLIGSFTPAMREADDACFAGASLWVDTEEALKKSGDLLGPLAARRVPGRRTCAARSRACRANRRSVAAGRPSAPFSSPWGRRWKTWRRRCWWSRAAPPSAHPARADNPLGACFGTLQR